MWVSKYDPVPSYTESINAARYTGTVMTEIDHNYVNPVSDDYQKTLNALMGESNRSRWVSQSYSSNSYKNGYKVFNEYMTHGVYLLYTNDRLTASEQEMLEKMKINSMQKTRGFSNFGNFYNELKRLYLSGKPNHDIASVYPDILRWCEQQNLK